MQGEVLRSQINEATFGYKFYRFGDFDRTS